MTRMTRIRSSARSVATLFLRNVIFELVSVFLNHRFDWHRARIAENTDRHTLHVRAHVQNHPKVVYRSMTVLDPMQHLFHPPSTFATLRALTAGFLGIESCRT